MAVEMLAAVPADVAVAAAAVAAVTSPRLLPQLLGRERVAAAAVQLVVLLLVRWRERCRWRRWLERRRCSVLLLLCGEVCVEACADAEADGAVAVEAAVDAIAIAAG